MFNNFDAKKIFAILLVFVALLSGCAATKNVIKQVPEAIVTEGPTLEPTVKRFDIDSVKLVAVDSTCFSRVGYDKDFSVLVVEFLESGAIYAYYDFSQSDYDTFMDADSLGKYYNANIKGYYDYERVG